MTARSPGALDPARPIPYRLTPAAYQLLAAHRQPAARYDLLTNEALQRECRALRWQLVDAERLADTRVRVRLATLLDRDR